MNVARTLPLAALLTLSAAASAPSHEALDYAFKFASAIVSDPKDMGKAQEAVVWDLAASGAFDDAAKAADRVEGWRRGTAYADLATAMAQSGRKDEARAMIAKADAVRATIEGWQSVRIVTHIASAYTALGESDKAKSLAVAVASEDAQQYAGRSTATIASGMAAKGDYDGAVKELDNLKDAKDVDDAWWRTAGFLDIAKRSTLPREKRLEAIASARESTAGIAGWRRAEALQSVADGYRALGLRDEAKASVAAAQAILVDLPDTLPLKAPLLSNCARSWAELGDKATAKSLLAQVEALAPKVQPIERPTVYANAASSFAAMKDVTSARRLFDRALAEAAGLVNARPRALAVVEICRSMSKSGVALDGATRARLDGLYAGLKDPW